MIFCPFSNSKTQPSANTIGIIDAIFNYIHHHYFVIVFKTNIIEAQPDLAISSNSKCVVSYNHIKRTDVRNTFYFQRRKTIC